MEMSTVHEEQNLYLCTALTVFEHGRIFTRASVPWSHATIRAAFKIVAAKLAARGALKIVAASIEAKS